MPPVNIEPLWTPNRISAPLLIPQRNGYTQKWEYTFAADHQIGDDVFVPGQFSYDGCTVPWWARQITFSPFDPIVMGPAGGHDWLYLWHRVSRQQADVWFVNALKYNGVGDFEALSIFNAVRMFGRDHWRNTPDDMNYINWLKPQITIPNFNPLYFTLEGVMS